MKRRTAIKGITLVFAGGTAVISGYKWYTITRQPDLLFVENNKELVASLAETIIPRTDTPGAKDCKVEDYIIKMIRDSTERKSQNRFIDGLKHLKQYSLDRCNKEFQFCSKNDQENILRYFEQNHSQYRGILGKIEKRYAGNSFFSTLKNYTVEGYCTSQPGATLGLSYVAVPGRYQGCIAARPEQKAWATN